MSVAPSATPAPAPIDPPPELVEGKPRPANIPAFFADATDADDFEAHWDRLWKAHWTPWDRGGPSMALHDILADRPDLFAHPPSPGQGRKTALVPGAGRGHDVLLLASFGYDAYGLDLSPDASTAARENELKNKDLDVYHREGIERGNVTWLTGDFFNFDFGGIGPFDLIFDYTFLCALPLELRSKWSRTMANSLAPSGRLVCLEFPGPKPTTAPGPPFALPPVVYEALLGRPGKDIPYDDNKAVAVDKLGPTSSVALRRLIHIVPKRTHAEGYDSEGSIIDRISVWAAHSPSGT